MIIEIFEANLEAKDVRHLIPRKGARAILKSDQTFVLLYHKNWNLYTLPGGGIEKDETPLEALKREVLEETGFEVENVIETITLKEYFFDSIWEHHFFYAETKGSPQTLKLTKEEETSGLSVVMKTYEEVLEIFSQHETNHLHAEAIYQREFLGFIHSNKTHEE